jgi:hypothetical protein
MSESTYRSRKLVTRRCPSLDEVSLFAREHDWATSADETDRGKREIRWQVGPSVNLNYVEDRVILMCYIFISGSIANIVDGYARIMENELEIMSISEIMNEIDGEQDPLRLGREIIALGVAAPATYDSGVFDLISAALQSPDYRVREMAIWATTYSSYAEYRPILRMVIENDPVQKVRGRAAMVLEAFDRAGVPEP